MKKPIFIILGIIAGIICCFFIALYFFLKPLAEVYKEKPIYKTLVLSNEKEIYVRATYRGITGDYQEVVFSETPITVPDKEKDYIFYTDEVVYKIDKNTLTLYAPQSSKSIPKTSFKNIEIIFKGLKTADEIRDYNTNYQKYGLEKISTHE